MSEHVPQPADPEALRRAVRPLRQAAAALGEPWGFARLTIGNAEALTSVFAPELALIAFAPFGALGDVAGSGGGDAGGASPGARRHGPRSGSAPRAATGSARGSAHGGHGSAAPAGGPGTPASGQRGAGGESPAGGGVPTAHAPAGRGWTSIPVNYVPYPGAAPIPVNYVPDRGTSPPIPLNRIPPPAKRPTLTWSELLGSVVDEVESFLPFPTGRGADDSASPSAPAGAHRPRSRRAPVPGPPRAAGPDHPSAGRAAEPEHAASGAGERAPGGVEQAAGAATPSQQAGGTFDLLRRALLEGALASPAGTAPEVSAAPDVARVPGAPAPLPVPYPNVAAALPGLRTPVDPAQLEPDELAWLVNEALIEQARRHGVDLT